MRKKEKVISLKNIKKDSHLEEAEMISCQIFKKLNVEHDITTITECSIAD